MAYSINIREQALNLRKRGYSLNELHDKTGVSKSVLSNWVRNVNLSRSANNRLLNKIKSGRFISAKRKREQTRKKLENYRKQAVRDLKKIKFDKIALKIICALMYWCEGGKNQFSGVRFTNSDPKLVKNFLYLFRHSFDLDERKFRVCVHLHKYHNVVEMIRFWSRATNISTKQFIKPFLKLNTGKNAKAGYPGCVDIRYHSNDIAKQLLMTAEVFLTNYFDGGIG